MSKEEILDKYDQPLKINGEWEFNLFNREDALLAMDEYSKQQAIAFGEWTNEHGWEKHIGENTWFNRMGYVTEYTSEQLYTQFIQSQKQINQ